MRRLIFLFFLFVFISIKGFSTYQIEDYLIVESDTLFFSNSLNEIGSPLEQIAGISKKIDKYTKLECYTSSCWRFFYAEWKIINNTLYLSKVFDCCNNEIIKNKIIEKILNRKFINGLMKADWVCGYFWCGKNRDIEKESIFLSAYKYNCKLSFEKGIIINKEEFDQKENPIDTISLESYDIDENKIYEYGIVQEKPLFNDTSDFEFYNYINKIILSSPYYGAGKYVIVEFIIERDNTISNVKILKSEDTLLDEEVIKIINEAPHKWTPGKISGKQVRTRYLMRIKF